MKRLLVAASAIAFALSTSVTARAEEPASTWESELDDTPAPSKDEPGKPGENAPPPAAPAPKAPAPAPKKPATATKTRSGRLAAPAVRSLTSTARVRDDGESRLEKSEDTVLGGRHWRIKTAQGAVHVWVPDGYDRDTAGTVVYVHGYYTDADGAWRDYELAKQFKKSRQNAMFIVPDAPASNAQSVHWPALTDLRKAVRRANIKLPEGPIVVMGHSGAFRTVMQWVDHKLVDQIILLDAMYAGEQAFDEFIKSGKRADDHKMIVVGASTAGASGAFAGAYKFAVGREGFPDSLTSFTKKERQAKLLYVRSQYDHMSIVTSQKVIPLLLRVTPLKAL
ncbi:MAG: hypothetical protein KF773_04660 [Deltaproteobacteria bacterium]|nr:hypothetical protein [Deltaproteobacteria bacterium]